MYRNYKFLVLLCIAMGLVTAAVFSLVGEKPVHYLPDSPQLAYDKHVLGCPECRGPLLDDKGNEHGMCELGFELLIKAAKAEQQQNNGDSAN